MHWLDCTDSLWQEIYGKAVAALKVVPGYGEVLAIPDNRPELKQANDQFDVVYKQAEKARLHAACSRRRVRGHALP